MWITVFVMAVAISLEPFRIGMTVLMLNRPRPMLQLLAFLCGGFAMGFAVGLAVLFGLGSSLMTAAHFNLPRVQIVIGSLSLLVAATLFTNVLAPLAAAHRFRVDAGSVGMASRSRSAPVAG
jgi:hypothetical protein